MKNKIINILLAVLFIGNILFFFLWVSTPTEEQMRENIAREDEVSATIEESITYNPEEWRDPSFVYSASLDCEVAVAFAGEGAKNKLSVSFKNLDKQAVNVSYRGKEALYRVDNETKERIWLIASSSSGYTDITSINKLTGEISSSHASPTENILSSSLGYCKSTAQ